MARKEVYSVREVADLLRVHRATVLRWIDGGKLSAFRTGRDYRIARGDLLAYWRERGGSALFEAQLAEAEGEPKAQRYAVVGANVAVFVDELALAARIAQEHDDDQREAGGYGDAKVYRAEDVAERYGSPYLATGAPRPTPAPEWIAWGEEQANT